MSPKRILERSGLQWKDGGFYVGPKLATILILGILGLGGGIGAPALLGGSDTPSVSLDHHEQIDFGKHAELTETTEDHEARLQKSETVQAVLIENTNTAAVTMSIVSQDVKQLQKTTAETGSKLDTLIMLQIGVGP